jgi:uncharacterized membrane protein
MTETQARNWAYAAAAGGCANALFIAFYASFAVQQFAEPHSVAAILGSAADYAGIPQNALLAVITGVVFRFLSRQQRSDQVLRIAGAMAFTTAAVCGVLTVTGLLPGVSAVAVGTVLAPYSPPRSGSWPSASAAPGCPARAAPTWPAPRGRSRPRCCAPAW